MKEGISSGPLGLHVGLWKANSLHSDMNLIDAHFRDICYNRGIILCRWLSGTDVELLKEPNNYKIHWLQTIVLVEVDFNLNCKMLGKQIINQMLAHSGDSRWNAVEQYGSKTGHSS